MALQVDMMLDAASAFASRVPLARWSEKLIVDLEPSLCRYLAK